MSNQNPDLGKYSDRMKNIASDLPSDSALLAIGTLEIIGILLFLAVSAYALFSRKVWLAGKVFKKDEDPKKFWLAFFLQIALLIGLVIFIRFTL
jgi:hypothetical protein